ncbi:integral membrane protein [alpha proteobacterium U9-1i]|nr:integral membrane protein [alpha proteobacterium U9-1i]
MDAPETFRNRFQQNNDMDVRMTTASTLSKVPAVTLGFWIIKILATTLGETGGDTVTMSMNWGYLAGTALFFSALVGLVALQIFARRFNPWLYWATIIASTTAGTTLADYATRSIGIGYAGGSALLLGLLLLSLAIWYWSERSISVDTVNTPKVEVFYWTTITFSQTLGTALGDWMAADASDPAATTGALGLGYLGAAGVFSIALAAVAALYFWTKASRVMLFWIAFILTRPLGAAVGDLLDKPLDHGGLAFSRPLASAVLALAIVALIALLPQRPGEHPGKELKPASSAN